MTILSQPRTGRHLMVLDDAETIAQQRRRRAAVARRRREALQVAVGVAVVLSIIAVILGVSPQTLVLVFAALFGLSAVGWRALQEHADARRRRVMRARIGQGIGAPRPKGGFSTTRHRSGAPVWIDHRAA